MTIDMSSFGFVIFFIPFVLPVCLYLVLWRAAARRRSAGGNLVAYALHMAVVQTIAFGILAYVFSEVLRPLAGDDHL